MHRPQYTVAVLQQYGPMSIISMYELLTGLYGCPKAMKLLCKKPDRTRREIERVISATLTPGPSQPRRHPFELPPEIALHVLQNRDRDISRVDFTATAYDDLGSLLNKSLLQMEQLITLKDL